MKQKTKFILSRILFIAIYKWNINKRKNLFSLTLSASFFFKYREIWVCNAISQERINQNTKFCILFCRKFQALTRECQNIFIIFTVSGVTAVRSNHDVMSDISAFGAERVKEPFDFFNFFLQKNKSSCFNRRKSFERNFRKVK